MPQPLHTKKDDDTTSLLLCPLREGITEHNRAARAHRANTITTRVSPPHSTVPRATTMTIFSSCCTVLFATVSAQVPTMYPSHWSMRTDETKEQINKKDTPLPNCLRLVLLIVKKTRLRHPHCLSWKCNCRGNFFALFQYDCLRTAQLWCVLSIFQIWV